MKFALYISAVVLGISLVALLALSAIARVNPSMGTFEGNSGQAWVGVVGFGALYALIFSAAALLCLGATKLLKYPISGH